MQKYKGVKMQRYKDIKNQLLLIAMASDYALCQYSVSQIYEVHYFFPFSLFPFPPFPLAKQNRGVSHALREEA